MRTTRTIRYTPSKDSFASFGWLSGVDDSAPAVADFHARSVNRRHGTFVSMADASAPNLFLAR